LIKHIFNLTHFQATRKLAARLIKEASKQEPGRPAVSPTEEHAMSRVQLALRVADLEASVAFYRKLFGAEPVKRRPGYANFAVAEPPLKLVLIEGAADGPTRLDHLGIEVDTRREVTDAADRLAAAGLATSVEEDIACCYTVQDKVWVAGPGAGPWEVYVVTGDADNLCPAAASPCCAPADERAVPGDGQRPSCC
jgi:catechol 2,3-dioxygenase-like lactoylglutathione lyase family enzyme